MLFFRSKIAPEEQHVISLYANTVTIANLGNEALFVNFDGAASAESLILPAKIGRQFNFSQPIKEVSVFSVSGTEVQIDDIR